LIPHKLVEEGNIAVFQHAKGNKTRITFFFHCQKPANQEMTVNRYEETGKQEMDLS